MDKREILTKKWVKALKWMMTNEKSEKDREDFESLTQVFDRAVFGWPQVESAVQFAKFEVGL